MLLSPIIQLSGFWASLAMCLQTLTGTTPQKRSDLPVQHPHEHLYKHERVLAQE